MNRSFCSWLHLALLREEKTNWTDRLAYTSQSLAMPPRRIYGVLCISLVFLFIIHRIKRRPSPKTVWERRSGEREGRRSETGEESEASEAYGVCAVGSYRCRSDILLQTVVVDNLWEYVVHIELKSVSFSLTRKPSLLL